MAEARQVQAMPTAAGEFRVEPLTASDGPLVRECLYHAIHVSAGAAAPPREVLDRPEIARYAAGWGRAGDLGVKALATDGEPVGAAWIRCLTADEPGYGYVDDRTPELGLAVLPEHRNRGIGTALLRELLAAAAAAGHRAVSLSVAQENPAVRLYARVGLSRWNAGGRRW